MNSEVSTKYENDVNLNLLQLAKRNPRYDSDWDINCSLIDYLIEGNKFYNDDIQEKIANKLLKYEDDLSSFYELISSIANEGFDTTTDNVFVIKNENKYIVAEGNRRILALLLLNKKVNFPEFEHFEITKGEDWDEEDSDIKNLINNYNKIKEEIKKYSEKNINKNTFLNLAIVNDDLKLRKIVFSRHSSGKIKGKKDWSTGKYFWSLYKFYNKNDSDDKNIEKIARTYNKSKKQIQNDTTIAFWIINLIIQSQLVKKDEVNEFLMSNKISSLRRNFVKPSLKIIGLENKTDIDKYEPLKEAGIENASSNEFYSSDEFKKFSKLVIDLFLNHSTEKNKKSISTRTANHSEEAIEKIMVYFNIKQNIKENTLEKDLNINTLWNLNEENIKNIKWENFEKKKIVKNYIEAKKYINSFDNIKLNLDAESKIKKCIIYLIDIINNFVNNKDSIRYLHSIASTIRTIDEIMIFLLIESNKNVNLILKDKKTLHTQYGKVNFNVINSEMKQLEKNEWLFGKEFRKWRKFLLDIKSELINWNKNSKIFKVVANNGDTVSYNIDSTFDKEVINGIIHEPFNYFKDGNFNIDESYDLMNEISLTIPSILRFILASYEKVRV